MKVARSKIVVVLALLYAACQGSDTTSVGTAAVASIALTTSAVKVAPQETVMVTATPLDASGHPITGRTVTWTSSVPSVATVDANGVVTAVAGGLVTLTATVDGKSASVTINVTFPPLPPPPPPPPPPPQPPPTTVDTVAGLGGWTLMLDRPLTSKYEGMSFPDAMHGWVIADRGDIIATANGGVTWTQQASGLGGLRSLDFIDNLHGFAGALTPKLFRTNDGGVNWVDITASLPKLPIGFCGITHVGNTVHVVGRYVGATDYFTSTDAGENWKYHDLSGLMTGLVDVAFLDQSTGFIGGTGFASGSGQGPATILKTTDGGATWRVVFTNVAGPGWAWKIYPLTSSIIYVGIESLDGIYRVAKSVDGGETWAIQIVATGQPLGAAGGIQGIGFLDINVGWVGGFFTGMYATTNGGLNWTKVTVTSGNINRFRRVGSTLFTAGTKGVIRYDPKP